MQNKITQEVIEYIDWNEFFRFWKIRDTDCDEAKKLRADALDLIKKLQNENFYFGEAKIEFFDVEAQGDDIIICAKEPVLLRLLRQQTKKPQGQPYYCLSDFIEKGDKIGVFAITVGAEFDKKSQEFAEADDMYLSLLYASSAQRLVEALSEYYHKKYLDGRHGIRAAAGFPSLPDIRIMKDIDKILDFKSIGITLSENYMMSPLSSVCGFYITNPKAKYFAVGKIGEDQLKDYAERGGESVSEAKFWLGG
ncbi:MAG: hypothetical protein FWE23_04935 [Chitinivibrionia bacterium]|nr:hypothetical protein [Chitinivibrionia bacterium]